MTTRFTLAALLCGALVVPATAGAADPDPANYKNAAKYCKAVKKAAGDENFKAMFGGKKNAYGKCVSKAARRDAKQEQTATKNASQECKAEAAQDPEEFKAAHGGKTFAEYYAGTSKGKAKGKNAHGKCVSQKAKENKAEADKQEKQDVNSAKECRKERAQDEDEFKAAHGGENFAEFYGTGNNKNAFGKCVSSKSKAKNQDGQTATA